MDNILNRKKQNLKEKGIVLPTVVISMVIISLFSVLILSFVLSTTLSKNMLSKNSNLKLNYEQIYFDFKQGNDIQFTSSNVYTYSAFDLETNLVKNENVKAIIVKNSNTILMFAVFEESFDKKTDIIYQTSNIAITLSDDNTFEFYNYHFKCDQILT